MAILRSPVWPGVSLSGFLLLVRSYFIGQPLLRFFERLENDNIEASLAADVLPVGCKVFRLIVKYARSSDLVELGHVALVSSDQIKGLHMVQVEVHLAVVYQQITAFCLYYLVVDGSGSLKHFRI